MAKLKISFNPIFLIFGFLIVYFGWLTEFMVYIIVLLLHEMAHYFVATCYGYKLNKIIFMPYGAGLSGENNIFKPSHEIVIALAGPVLNIVLVIINVALWWLVPYSYAYTKLFVDANLVLGLFNLLPIFPLDGGRIFVAYFSKSVSKIKLYRIMKTVGIISSVVFSLLFVLSVLWKVNLTLLFIAMFLLSSSLTSYKDVYYQRSYVKNFKAKAYDFKPMQLKTYVISKNMNLRKAIKYIKGNNFTQFVVLDENYGIDKTITEVELLKLLQVYKDT